MQINELNSIRYLMGQMDPSEMIEFENEMRNDADLLIEVESLRSSYKKLGNLPTINAPNNVLESTLENVIRLQKQNIRKSKWYSNYVIKSAAAVVVILLSVSIVYFGADSNRVDDITNEPAQTKVVQQTPVSIKSAAAPVTQKANNSITQPWVDRNEIITIEDGNNAVLLKSLDQEYTESYNKLILVKPSQQTTIPNREIHYTNSPGN